MYLITLHVFWPIFHSRTNKDDSFYWHVDCWAFGLILNASNWLFTICSTTSNCASLQAICPLCMFIRNSREKKNRTDETLMITKEASATRMYKLRALDDEEVLANIRGLARRLNVRRNSLRVLKFEIGASASSSPTRTHNIPQSCIICFHLNDEGKIACLSQSQGSW